MPRKARIDAPGALHHIVVRGIERKAIFREFNDYSNMLVRLETVLTDTHTPCFAWALMPNHFHMLTRTGDVPLSTVMRRLLTGYAQEFNRRHHRHGPLFQNRFKSILCEYDLYFLELVRYIHLNPLRGGIVKDLKGLKSHPYSGHGVVMGKLKNTWQDVNSVLSMFASEAYFARRSYAAFVAKGVESGRRPELTGGGLVRSLGGWAALKSLRSKTQRLMGDERILGSSDFVESVLAIVDENYAYQTLAKAKGLTLALVIRKVGEHFDIPMEFIKGNGKQRKLSRARAIICWLAVDKLGKNGRQVAERIGISPSAVSKARTRGRSDNRSDLIWRDLLKMNDCKDTEGHL